MIKLVCFGLFYLFCLTVFGETSEIDYYNLEIKNNIKYDYSGSFDNKPISENISNHHHQKWFAEDFFDATEDYFKKKERQYKEYKRGLENSITNSLNRTIVPTYMKNELEVIVDLEENVEDFKLKYRYSPKLIKESYIDLGIEEEEFKLSYVYSKPVDGLGGYFFNSIGYILDTGVKSILEISKMKVK